MSECAAAGDAYVAELISSVCTYTTGYERDFKLVESGRCEAVFVAIDNFEVSSVYGSACYRVHP